MFYHVEYIAGFPGYKNLAPMKEEEFKKTSLIAGLITQVLCTEPAPGEKDALHAWAQENTDNKILLDDLTDVEKLNQQLIDYQKFEKTIKLARIHQRLFGK
jgi:hypothetical protein